ncbi:MAG TPA: TPM domain-containing protein [Candidatus Paceibacterota bacterium]|nr:TPM domain-containing protein [Candidatus Paceibacterota bacterium]
MALIPASAALAYANPGPATGYVNDFAQLLPGDRRAALEAKLSNLHSETGAEVVVATVKSLGGDTVENFAAKLFEDWGIGRKDVDNGILVLVATEDRDMRIEVGYGLEPVVTDADASLIVRNIVIPAFRKDDYAGGLDAATDQIIGLIKNDPEAVTWSEDAARADSPFLSTGFIVFALFVAFRTLIFMARSKSWWLGGVLGGGLGLIFIQTLLGVVGCVLGGLLVDFLLSRYAGTWFKDHNGPGGPWFFGGFGGGGRGGGGFGGFGGGSSGGGGASGRW